MIDIFIKLLEKLIEFAKAKKDAEDRVFEQLIKPIFVDMKSIHEDYLHLFEACRRDLAEGFELSIIAKRLAEDRLKQEALRRSVIAFVQSYRENPHYSDYSEFFKAVAEYLNHASINRQGTMSTVLLGLLRHLAPEEFDDKFIPQIDLGSSLDEIHSRKELIAITEFYLNNIRIVWDIVSKTFATIAARNASA